MSFRTITVITSPVRLEKTFLVHESCANTPRQARTSGELPPELQLSGDDESGSGGGGGHEGGLHDADGIELF